MPNYATTVQTALAELESTGGHDACALLEVQTALARTMGGFADLGEMTEHGRLTYLLTLAHKKANIHKRLEPSMPNKTEIEQALAVLLEIDVVERVEVSGEAWVILRAQGELGGGTIRLEGGFARAFAAWKARRDRALAALRTE